MQVFTDAARSVAANSQTTNIVAGWEGEFVTRPSGLRIRACASAVGILMTLIVGGQTVVDDQEISQANRWPLLPDDSVAEVGVGGIGERIILRYRNRTAGALTVNTVLELIPIG